MSKRTKGKKKLEVPLPVVAPSDRFASARARRWAYLAVFLISFALRVASSGTHFFAPYDPGYRNFEFYDSNYQARRTEVIIRDFPPCSRFRSGPRMTDVLGRAGSRGVS